MLTLIARVPEGLEPRLEVHRLLLRAAALMRLGELNAARDNAGAAASVMKEHGLTMTAALLPQEDLPPLKELVRTFEPGIPEPFTPIAAAASLTKREMVVLKAFAESASAADVARLLNVSINTVKCQRRSILKKLGAPTREEALAAARRQGLLDD
jgi:DNA-binding CsgD family transcriptional regulator